MRWRDIRIEKPTVNDGEIVLMLFGNGSTSTVSYKYIGNTIAWIPLNELPAFVPVPDPPKGYRLKVDGDAFDQRAKYLNAKNEWVPTGCDDHYAPSGIYCIPLDPPAPTYRPFANAEEFAPHKDRWISRATDDYRLNQGSFRVEAFDEHGIWNFPNKRKAYKEILEAGYRFADGDKEPFGVKVDPC